MTTLSVPYTPREQFIEFHKRSERWAALVIHRRGGKTVACINDLVARAIYTPKQNARYAYIAPFYRQAKDVAWTYLKHYAENLIKDRPRESELRIELLNGAWITLYGADNPDALRGIYLDGVVLDEFGDCRPSLWGQVILPTLVDRSGWAVFIGTAKGKNHFYQIARRAKKEKGWFSLILKASKSGLIGKEELTEMKAQMSEDEYAQEMECSFEAAIKGAFYADLISKIEQMGQLDSKLKYDPHVKVSVATDLGYTDSTALWFWQERPDGIAVIDYEEDHGKPLDFYFNLLRSKPYNYDKIWLPHDAKATSLQTGRSTVEQFLGEEFPIALVPQHKVQDGVNAVRKVLPSCWFNSQKCFDGIEALRAYRRQFNDALGHYGKTHVHNWASDGADAFRMLASVAKTGIEHPVTDPRSGLAPRGYSLDDLWSDLDRREKLAKFNNMRI